MKKLMANQQMHEGSNVLSAQMQQQMMYQEMEKGLAEEQLEVDTIIHNLFNLLCGNRITFDENGRKIWEKTQDKSLRVLSDNGIQRMMQVIMAYVNKLKMLSNYKNEEILKAMYDFTTELNDNFLLRYEDIFYTPTFEECKNILRKNMKEKEDIKRFSNELLGIDSDDDQIKEEIKKEMEGKIMDEMKKIRESERKKRVKEYGMLILLIEHQVLDTYRRAEGGKERDTLRKHASFAELRAVGEPKKDGGMFGWLNKI